MAQKTTRQERRRIADEYQQAGKEYAKMKYEDDRTPFVKKIDPLTKFFACLLTVVFFINLSVVVGGGGYDYSKVVPVMGIANYKVTVSDVKPEIGDNTMIFVRTADKGSEGDIVLYQDGKNYAVGRIQSISSGGGYTVKSDSSPAAAVGKDAVIGSLRGKTGAFCGLIQFLQSSLGIVVTGLLVFFFLLLPDILMFKKRKAQAEIEKEKMRKKKEMDLKKRMGKEEQAEEKAPQKFTTQDKLDEKKAKKQAKVKEETEYISKEMADLRRKMAEEEAELDRKLGKK